MASSRECPRCASTDREEMSDVQGLVSNEDYVTYRCNTCQLIYEQVETNWVSIQADDPLNS